MVAAFQSGDLFNPANFALWLFPHRMNLSRLLLLNGIATLAAGIVLFVAPGWIPSTVGIHLDRSANLLGYLLGSSEIAVAALCLFARSLDDAPALRAVVLTLITFHAASAMAEAYAFSEGVSAVIWINVAVRAVMIALLWKYRPRKPGTGRRPQ